MRKTPHDDGTSNAARMARALRSRLAELGMSQADLERTSGVSDFTIRRILNGVEANYRADRLAKIAIAVGWPATTFRDMTADDTSVTPSHDAGKSAQLEQRIEHLESQLADLAMMVTRLAGTLAELGHELEQQPR